MIWDTISIRPSLLRVLSNHNSSRPLYVAVTPRPRRRRRSNADEPKRSPGICVISENKKTTTNGSCKYSPRRPPGILNNLGLYSPEVLNRTKRRKIAPDQTTRQRRWVNAWCSLIFRVRDLYSIILIIITQHHLYHRSPARPLGNLRCRSWPKVGDGKNMKSVPEQNKSSSSPDFWWWDEETRSPSVCLEEILLSPLPLHAMAML